MNQGLVDYQVFAHSGASTGSGVMALKSVEVARVADAGHMLHHDQPQAVARLIEDFVGRAGQAAP